MYKNVIILDERRIRSTLLDGIPRLTSRSRVTASIPHETAHARCIRTESDAFALVDSVDSWASCALNSLWEGCLPNEALSYAETNDVIYYTRKFLACVARAMGTSFITSVNILGIQFTMPDILVLFLNDRIVGIVQIKVPGDNILQQPTVLGELYDQLILVEGVYGSGPIIGIQTTLEEWAFCWFPNDSEHFSSGPLTAPSYDAMYTYSGDLRSAFTHDVASISIGSDIADKRECIPTNAVIERRLCSTPVINAHTDYTLLLRHLTSAFIRMSQLTLGHSPKVPRCVIQFTRGDVSTSGVSFLPSKSMPFDVDGIVSNNFPPSNQSTLVAIADLGRGSTGRSWLCCTMHESPFVCVLKFRNQLDSRNEEWLQEEKNWWMTIYPEFAAMVSVDLWGNNHALIMPRFLTTQGR